MDRATFNQHVRDALAHLYDPPRLQNHPLAELLGVARPSMGRPPSLGQLLLDAIEQLRPPTQVQPDAPSWRRYHVLALRYREGLAPEPVARQLKLSERQARRDHQDGVEAVAAILWDRLVPPSDWPADITRGTPSLEAELLKLGAERQEEPTDLWATLQGTLSVVSSLAEKQRIHLDATPVERPLPVMIGRAPLRQLLLTLLSYAMERTPDSRMTVSIASTPDVAMVEVQTLPRRASTCDQSERQGLLAEAQQLWGIARDLAQLHGVTLELDARGQQESIMLTLPAARVITVLVIDDSPDFLRLFRRYLIGTRYNLCAARTPAGALQLAVEARPDVIILDVLMPTHDGWEILSALKANPQARNVPVIICSVLPERTLALSLGVADFLPKPVTQKTLLAALERVAPAVTAPP